jgi:hypothetical protein
MNNRRLLTQGDIEHNIIALSDQLEEQTYLYEQVSDDAAEAEADYKLANAQAMIRIAASGIKTTVQDRQARVDVECNEQFRVWKIAEARRQSCKEHLLSLRARMDAQRSLAANVRHQT